MIRILIPLLLFLLPFAIYGLYVALQRANAKANGSGLAAGGSINYVVLSIIGVFLAAVGVGLIGTLVSKEHASRYEPPRLTPEGRLIPGQFITDEEEGSTAPEATTKPASE